MSKLVESGIYVNISMALNGQTHLSDILRNVLGDVQTLLDFVLQVIKYVIVFVHGLEHALSVLLYAEGGVSGW